MPAPGMIEIPIEEYNELLDDQLFLECLRNNGVDNWDWYDEAVNDYQAAKADQDE